MKEDATMKYGVYSANEWLYPDTKLSESKQQVDLITARNSFGCAQMLVHSDEPVA